LPGVNKITLESIQYTGYLLKIKRKFRKYLFENTKILNTDAHTSPSDDEPENHQLSAIPESIDVGLEEGKNIYLHNINNKIVYE
jgi:hypothetical protein